ncbi:MAG: cytochrome-c peroxidase [Rhodothermales bacterium]
MKYLYHCLLYSVLLVGSGFWLAGCELMSSGDSDDAHLDETLIALVTREGQRGLSNFILPESDDFATIPHDPANPLTADKVALGKLLFHETALATEPRHEEGRGTYSCAACHHAGAGFQAGRQQGISDGGSGWGVNGEGRTRHPAYEVSEMDVQAARSPSILNSGYQQVMSWAGVLGANGPNEGTEAHWIRGTLLEVNHLGFDGLESQAIVGLQAHRMGDIKSSIVASHPTYTELWERVFPGEEVSVLRAGLAIAAFERTVLANKAPFQRWLKGDLEAMSAAEKRGAILFFDKANCESCHTGPPLNSVTFYALGMPDMAGPNIFGEVPETLGRGWFLQDPNEFYKFKIPQLYNLKDSPFYGHGGTFKSIREVVEYYNAGIPARTLPEGRLEPRFKPLGLTRAEIDDLVAFLTESLRDPDLMRYVPESLPSGNCTPVNDPVARIDLGC